jgi:hypothetical protein
MKPNISRVLMCSLGFAMLNPTYESTPLTFKTVATNLDYESGNKYESGM